MVNLCGEGEEIIAIASDQNAPAFGGETQHIRVGRGHRQERTELEHLVTKGVQRKLDVIRHVVVEQEPHGASAAICRATSTSISPR